MEKHRRRRMPYAHCCQPPRDRYHSIRKELYGDTRDGARGETKKRRERKIKRPRAVYTRIL